MAIGGSPTSMRITAWHHTCCDTVRWSAQRTCDLCGTQAEYHYRESVPISALLNRLHPEDKPGSAAAPPQPPAAGNPAPVTRPPGARPHRNHEEDTAPTLPPPRPAQVRRWRALHTVWLAGALALVLALDAAASADSGVDPLLPMLIAVAAILLVVVVPMALAGKPGEAAP